MAWVKFSTSPIEGSNMHAAEVSNPNDKPVKDVRLMNGERIVPIDVSYSIDDVVLLFHHEVEAEVAL